MINGEGARGNTSQDPFAQKPEVSNGSSLDYSSCEESEFGRYCSANSVMGTPSLCSSVGTCNDFLDLDFGSGRSLGLGEDGFRERLARISGDRSVSTSGGFDYLCDRRIEFHNKDANGIGLDVDPHESSNRKVPWHMSKYGDSDSEGLKSLRVQRDSSDSPRGEIQNSLDPFDYKESRSPEEEETSSRYEHSDDDGSMFNCGSEDDEHKMDSYNMRNFQYLQDSKRNNGNSLGSDDWDDFIQETENNNFSFLSLNKHNDQQQENVETDRDFANTSVGAVTAPNTGRLEQEEMVRVVPAATFLANGKEDPKSFSTRDSMAQKKDFLVEKASLKLGLTYKHSAPERELQCVSNEGVIGPDVNYVSENDYMVKSKQSNFLFDPTVVQCSSSAITVPCGKEGVHYDDSEVHEAHPITEDDFSTHVKEKAKFSSASVNRSAGHLPPIKPMLCVSAVNPYLFSKVPALFQVTSIRRKIGAMMPYVRCPFRRSIQKGVGSRRYLLENNEFFALRDLVDLSKGAFAGLPVLVETLSTKILDHITQRCLICCDVGIPCGARQACEDPSSLIFPFQEDEVKRCKSCKTVFHKPCLKNLLNCPCGAGSETQEVKHEALARKSDSGSPVRFLSYLFSKKSRKSNPVILMGSLPSTFSDPL